MGLTSVSAKQFSDEPNYRVQSEAPPVCKCPSVSPTPIPYPLSAPSLQNVLSANKGSFGVASVPNSFDGVSVANSFGTKTSSTQPTNATTPNLSTSSPSQ